MPDPSILEKLSGLIDRGEVKAGPVFAFDRANRVFLVAVIEQSVIVHWQVESCYDQAEADGLMQRYRSFVGEALARLLPDGAEGSSSSGIRTLQ